MKTEQRRWRPKLGWQQEASNDFRRSARLVFVFGGRDALASQNNFDEIKSAYPKACIIGCSSSGEILDTEVTENHLVTTAVIFERSHFKVTHAKIENPNDSFKAGKELSSSLDPSGLIHVLVFSDGLKVNGSELVKGLKSLLPSTGITGGLAGDGISFKKTLVCSDQKPESGGITAIGFYGSRLKVGYGSIGGWVPFGPERLITRSEGNVLYELDGQPALDLYKKYLGEKSSDLSANRFYFPLSIKLPPGETGIVRTILAIDENNKSLTFAGDVTQGIVARLMKADFGQLVVGSADAARTSTEALGIKSPALSILFSCVGRKIVLDQRVEEEIECVRAEFGKHTAITGFYSYGEIGPSNRSEECQLHNQTMTITSFYEER